MAAKTNMARLTPRMRGVLTDLANGRDPYLRLRGRSAYGGMTKTIGALRLRGLVDGTIDTIYITDAGRAALSQEPTAMTARPQDVELLPCPFCGSACELVNMSDSLFVACAGSECMGLLGGFDSAEEAASRWNTRANLSAALASAQAREEELRKIAERIQYADTHAQVAKDDAGDFICLPPWLWLQIRDAARALLSTNAETQTGETNEAAE